MFRANERTNKRGTSTPRSHLVVCEVNNIIYAIGGDLIHVNGHADLLLAGSRVRAGGTVGAGLGTYAAVGATALLGALEAACFDRDGVGADRQKGQDVAAVDGGGRGAGQGRGDPLLRPTPL